MTEKAKRKGNPRRRLLFQLLIVIGLIIALISAGVYVLRPTEAEIVFIAPDDEGIDQVWITNLNNPENPHQLSSLSENQSLIRLLTMPDSPVIVYQYMDSNLHTQQMMILNLKTDSSQIIGCGSSPLTYRCDVALHDDWIAYFAFKSSGHSTEELMLTLFNVETEEQREIYEINRRRGEDMRYLQWIADTNVLVFHNQTLAVNAGGYTYYPDESYGFYSLDEDRIINTLEILNDRTIPEQLPYNPQNLIGLPLFSPDGTRYAITMNADNSPIQSDLVIYQEISPGSLEFGFSNSAIYTDSPLALDWHPDSEQVIVQGFVVSRSSTDSSTLEHYYRLDIYNAVSDETRTIEQVVAEYDRAYPTANFNHDGSMVLFARPVQGETYYQLAYFDVESEENVALPLSGHNPQWVNGGR